jgi:putative hemolysin
MRKSEGLALSLAGPLNFISKLFTPFVWFLTLSTNTVLRCMGIDPKKLAEEVHEDDILLMVDNSDKILDEEKQMIQNVFEFNDIAVNDFATHRTEVTVLWEDDSLETWDSIIRSTFHKHYPVCKDTTDNIIGILNIKPYFQMEKRTKEKVLAECLSKPYLVPETIKADLLFKQMKQSKTCFAVVLDEHGGVNGVVTFDDILEQIVGDFNEDTIEEAQPNMVKTDENQWTVLGITPIDEIN